MFRLWVKTQQGEWQREVDYRFEVECHRCHHKYLEGGTQRYKGGWAPLPLRDVSKGFLATIHCWQREPKEPHSNRGCEVARLTDHSTSTTVDHRVASPRTVSSRELAVPPPIKHQAPHGWGIMWHCSPWCLWCIIRSTILVEVTCCDFKTLT